MLSERTFWLAKIVSKKVDVEERQFDIRWFEHCDECECGDQGCFYVLGGEDRVWRDTMIAKLKPGDLTQVKHTNEYLLAQAAKKRVNAIVDEQYEEAKSHDLAATTEPQPQLDARKMFAQTQKARNMVRNDRVVLRCL